MSPCQAANSFQASNSDQHSLNSGKPHQDCGHRFPSLLTAGQLGNEANINSLWEKTRHLRNKEFGLHPGLGYMLSSAAQRSCAWGVGRLQEVWYKRSMMGENPLKSKGHWCFFETKTCLLLYIGGVWWLCLFISTCVWVWQRINGTK